MAIRPASAQTAPDSETRMDSDRAAVRRAFGKLLAATARTLIVGLVGISVVSSSGCSVFRGARAAFQDNECIDEFMISYRNRALAERAWHCYKPDPRNQNHMREFKDGFIQGYMEVASGGNPCVPAIAPTVYWGWKYQCAAGQSAVEAWFDGFPLGIKAADMDGVGNWSQVRVIGRSQAIPTDQTMTPAPVPGQEPADVDNPFYSEEQEELPAPEPIPVDLDDQLQGVEAFNFGDQNGDEAVFDSIFAPTNQANTEYASEPDESVAIRFGDQDPVGSEVQGIESSSDEIQFNFD